eukprot:3260704-Heterocapsa_arctica.AAC.1
MAAVEKMRCSRSQLMQMSNQHSSADRRCNSVLCQCPLAMTAGQDTTQYASTRVDTSARTQKSRSTGLISTQCHSYRRVTDTATLMHVYRHPVGNTILRGSALTYPAGSSQRERPPEELSALQYAGPAGLWACHGRGTRRPISPQLGMLATSEE